MSIFDQIKRQADTLAAQREQAAEHAAQCRREHLQQLAAEADLSDLSDKSKAKRARELYAIKANDTLNYAASKNIDAQLLLTLFGKTMPALARQWISGARARVRTETMYPNEFFIRAKSKHKWAFCKQKMTELGLDYKEPACVYLLAAVQWLALNKPR